MSSIAFEHNSAIFGSIVRLIAGVPYRVANFAVNYVSRARAERQLAALDDRMLSDIGLERADIHGLVWNADNR